jgi:hypothetical protein
MENSENPLYALFKKVNDIDIVDYLETQGFHPVKDKNGKCWYHSPIRDGDSEPSFIVFKATNTWKDFGTGEGKSLVDLGMKLFSISAIEFVKRFDDESLKIPARPKLSKEDAGVKLNILGVKPLSSYELNQYILSRKIPLSIARQYCIEAEFEIFKKQFAVGFKNDQGGYELRNSYFKGSSLPKDSTFINNGSSILNVTEGFFSFLSDVTMIICQKRSLPNFLILNGTGFFEKKIPLMREHDRVNLLLDHGKGGRRFTEMGLSVDKKKFLDDSWFYLGHDDVNDWWKSEGYKTYLSQQPDTGENRSQGLRR